MSDRILLVWSKLELSKSVQAKASFAKPFIQALYPSKSKSNPRRMATTCEIIPTPMPTMSEIMNQESPDPINMNYPTDTLAYKDFDFHVVATVAEYINNVEQHSYDKLTDEWWVALFTEVVAVIDKPDVKLSEVTKMILDKALAMFPEKFLTVEQTAELNEELYMAVSAFHTLRNLFECNCGSLLCPGDCGWQSCGMCIDVCRCPMYW